MPYIDTHLDAFFHMVAKNRTFNKNEESTHVDLPKAHKGGLIAGFFTGFPNCTYFFSEETKFPDKFPMTRPDYTDAELTDEYLARWLKIVGNPENGLKQIKTLKDLDQQLSAYDMANQTQKIGAILHFEGAAGIDEALNKLYIFYAVGLRSIGLTWNETNQFATGVPGDINRGLTQAGKDLLDAMESLGILIDVSHLNDKSFWDVQSHTNTPIFASHSNVRKRANHMRNLQDDMIKAIADSGGTVGVNLCKGFLSTDENHQVNMNCAFEMIKEIINLTGSVDHVHIGSDFDGCSITPDINNVGDMPMFFDKLKEYLDLSDTDIRKIQYENITRVIKNTWKK